MEQETYRAPTLQTTGTDLASVQQELRRSLDWAYDTGPSDALTRSTHVVVKGLTSVINVLILPIAFVTTLVSALLVALSLGIALVLFEVIWWVFLFFLVGTSWLWVKAWYLRPLLIIPGVLVAVLASTYVGLITSPDKGAKFAKLTLAGEWPYSWYIWQSQQAES